MRKVLNIILVFTLLIVLIANSQVNAQPKEKLSKEEFMKKTDKLMLETATLSQEERLKKLEKLGWEAHTLKDDGYIAPLSYPGDGQITNYFFKSTDYPGTFLVEALWKFTTTMDAWDSNSQAAYDVIAIGITDQNGNPVNRQPTNAKIVVQDHLSNAWSNMGSVYNYDRSGVTYTSADQSNGIGARGYAWFYMSPPTSGSLYYMKSKWIHTWNTTTVNLSSINISYPSFGVTATFSSTPKNWTVSDQDVVTFK